MPTRRLRQWAAGATTAAVVVTVLIACSDNRPTAPESGAVRVPLVITSLSVTPNPLNALSTVIAFTATGADSARVVYTTAGDTAAATPFVAVQGDSGRIVTLGLLPNASYSNRLEILGGGSRVTETVQVATGALPPYVQQASLTINKGSFSRGFTLFSPILYKGDSVLALAFDSRGRVRWYREFDPGTGAVDVRQQRSGHFTLALGGSTGGDGLPVQFIEFLPSGEVVAAYTAPDTQFTDAHELIQTGPASSPTLHWFAYTAHPFDFSPLGGPANAIGFGHQVLRESAAGTVEFSFNSWDHFSIADWIEPTGAFPPDDFDHPNSLDFDLDSNYIVSYRHLGAVIKLDAQTGQKIWQLGGRLGQFTILKDSLGLFSGQHCVRVLGNGHLLMYDNGLRHNPQHTRAVEYALDLNKMTATMVWEYEPNPSIFTAIVGSVQRLSNGNTLVGFGLAGQVHEVDSKGNALAIANFNLHTHNQFYRAIRMGSLYQFATP
jgi:arylsulfate sulfotransferase